MQKRTVNFVFLWIESEKGSESGELDVIKEVGFHGSDLGLNIK